MTAELLEIGGEMVSHTVVPIQGDGACLFRSISYSVYGTDVMAREVRTLIAEYIRDNWNEEFQLMSHDNNGDNYTSAETYFADMIKAQTYGGLCELTAAGLLFPYVFEVFHRGRLFQSFGTEGRPVNRLRFTATDLSWGHFDVYLAPIDFPPQTVLLSQSHGSSSLFEKNVGNYYKKPETVLPVPKKTQTKRRARYTGETRNKQLKKANERCSQEKPEVNREAVHKYTQKHPDVHRTAVGKYTQKHPDVHRTAVGKYTQKHPDVHRTAVGKYTQKHPDVNRRAVSKYTAKVQHRRSVLRLQEEFDDDRAVANLTENQFVDNSESFFEESSRLAAGRELHALFSEAQLNARNDDSTSMRVQNLEWKNKNYSGFEYNEAIDYANASNIGKMNIVCDHCRALKWKGESKGLCCFEGKVKLESIQPPPEPLKSLLTGIHASSKSFHKEIRSYNSAFQLTSFGANEIVEGNFMPTFKIQGQVYHRIGSLLPIDNGLSKFLQIYFISDYNAQADVRMTHVRNLNKDLITELQEMLHEHNPYIRDFKAALENLPRDQEQDYKLVINADRRPAAAHPGRYNEPTTNEVAVLMVNEECAQRDIVIRARDDRLQRVSETHRSYDALQYPLMFSRGEDGYNFLIRNVNPSTGEEATKKTSAMKFYCYRIMVRDGIPNYLHYFGQVFNQYLVDMYAKIESERLLFIRLNQKKLRVDDYIHLQDALYHDRNIDNLGRLVILPSTFTGGPRFMHERTQDAFCYVRKCGRPDLFITMTTNPKWTDIVDELLPGQTPHDRHDIVSRVFHLKMKKLMDLLTKDNIFGAPQCYMFSIEWQKRGLPHAHILLWLRDKIRPNQMDDVIRAEIPDPIIDPALFEIVKSHMIHGPCGALNIRSPCMKDGRCNKRFPKPFVEETITGDDGYPSYRRRKPHEGGFTAPVRMCGQTLQVDNRWVVPYSPVLSRTFKTHLNVESCSSVQAVKYICKYVNKGSDQATFVIQNENDEVLRYQSGRYVSTAEAVWRILAYPINERFPFVEHLHVHLENGQRVYFNANNVRDRLENPRNTTLLAFFQICQNDPFAKTLLYQDIPMYYTYDKQRGIFKRRKRGVPVAEHPGVFKDNAMGRVYTVHPSNSECYYLRLLLHNVRGPTSFDELKSVEGTEYPTYQAACAARHLLEDDKHWDDTLQEACVNDSAGKLRHLFAIMLVFCQLSDPMLLWNKYRDSFSEDLLRDLRRRVPDVNTEDYRADIENRCLLQLQERVTAIGGNALLQYGLPSPVIVNAINLEYAAETNYDVVEMAEFVYENEPKLTSEQKKILHDVMDSVDNHFGQMFFLDAPGGTGKTFLIKMILNKLRGNGKIVLAVASSGIAATLLPGGKTAHAAFKIPINLDISECPVCEISKNSLKAKMIQDSVLIVWDECTMANKKAVEAVDRTLQDLRNDDRTMGGLTFLFSGDFRQTLPVVTRGTRADEVNACLKRSRLWGTIKTISLTENMRARLGGDSHAVEFSTLLLKIGDGTIEETDGEVQLPSTLCTTVPTVADLISSVYPNIESIATKENSWFCERAILAPKNEQVAAINKQVLGMFDAGEMMYYSINTVLEQDEATNYPTEFLNSLTAPGLPAHEITLKVGAPIMLLRNLSPPKLCNGTRLRVKSLQRNVIEGIVLTGCGSGEEVYIPRIPIIPTNYPFQFKRLQFPVSVCFAMTINKSQGQTLRTAGVDLRTPTFSHGQLYVACSRVSGGRDLFVCAPNNKTRNVVYKEALL